MNSYKNLLHNLLDKDNQTIIYNSNSNTNSQGKLVFTSMVAFNYNNQNYSFSSGIETVSFYEAENMAALTALVELKLTEIPASRIYSRTGDSGTTSLYNGNRRLKTNIIFDVLGTIDELNSWIGLLEQLSINDNVFEEPLVNIQMMLQDIGSFIATPVFTVIDCKNKTEITSNEHVEKFNAVNLNTFNEHPATAVKRLELLIDRQEQIIGKLTKFILPSGCKNAKNIHICRTVVRRCERLLFKYFISLKGVIFGKSDDEQLVYANGHENNEEIMKYMNRLSDYLFSLARFANHINDVKENIYAKTLRVFAPRS